MRRASCTRQSYPVRQRSASRRTVPSGMPDPVPAPATSPGHRVAASRAARSSRSPCGTSMRNGVIFAVVVIPATLRTLAASSCPEIPPRMWLSGVPRRDADRDRGRVNLDAQFLAGRARTAIEFVADLLAEPDSELLPLRDLDEGRHGGLAASEPGEGPGPLDRVPGRHHSDLEPPVVRSRL